MFIFQTQLLSGNTFYALLSSNELKNNNRLRALPQNVKLEIKKRVDFGTILHFDIIYKEIQARVKSVNAVIKNNCGISTSLLKVSFT
jgi:hypothetical protein